MKVLLGMLLVGLMATSAFALVDPDADMMGVYFDLNADVVCNTHAFGVNFDAYLMWTNPSAPECQGFECELLPTGGLVVALSTYPVSATNVGTDTPTSKMYIVGYGSPIPTSPATVLVTLTMTPYVPTGFFQIGPANPSSLPMPLPAVLDGAFNLLSVGYSTLDGINAARTDVVPGVCDVVPSEDASWGEIKSLFR